MIEGNMTDDQRRMFMNGATRQIEAEIRRLFPDAEGQRSMDWAEEINTGAQAAGIIEVLERADKDPKKDLEALRKAQRNLALAQRQLGSLGHEGGWAILRSDIQTFAPADDLNFRSALAAVDVYLTPLVNGLAHAAELVDLEAPSTASIFDDDDIERPKPTKPRETKAMLVAQSCYKAFAELAGKPPTVPSRDGVAYGPFLDLVAAVFGALGIQASPETWARAALSSVR